METIKAIIKKLQDFIEKSNVSGVIIAVISFLVIALFSITDIYDMFEYKLYDIRFRWKPSIQEIDSLVFVDIDDNSIYNSGKFPWPRYFYGEGLRVLNEVGARLAAFDIEFPDRSPQMLNEEALVELKGKAAAGRVSRTELDTVVKDNDRLLAEGIKLFKKVILPYHFEKTMPLQQDYSEAYKSELAQARKIFLKKAALEVPKKDWEKYKDFIDEERVAVTIPIPELVRVAHSFGFVDRDQDLDGTERRIRLVRFFEGRLYFEMAMVMLMDLCGVKKENLEIQPGMHIVLKGAVNPVTFEKTDIVIPIDSKGMMYINWAGQGKLDESFHHLPYSALFEYPKVKDIVNDFFSQAEEGSGKNERSAVLDELAGAENDFYSEGRPEAGQKKWGRVKELRKKLVDIELGYKKDLKAELDSINKIPKKQRTPEHEQALVTYGFLLKAIDIYQGVRGLRDKTVLTGLVATGTQDMGNIPISNEYMMVGTYHNIINTVLNKAFIIKAGNVSNYLIMFVLAVIMGVIVQRLAARMSLIAIVAMLVVINIINYFSFAYLNYWFDQFGANLAVFAPSMVIAGMKLLKEEGQKRYIKNAFSRYLSPGIIDKIIESPDALELGGQNRELTIFFSDIAKFSTLSEKLTPHELVERLNEYLSEMSNLILAQGGTIDKYIGDAIMAFYGAPQPFEDHALRCVYAAIDMKKRLGELQEKWRTEGKEIIRARMGMNTGEAVVGNMGSANRLDYTVMGDSVNLASRLEGANKYYGTNAMISGSTYEIVKDHVECRKLDIIRVVGKDKPIPIYELMSRKGTLPAEIYEMLEQYNKGLDYFTNRDWKESLAYFKKAVKIIKDDGPSLTYIGRCEEFIKKPPSRNWDGVYKMTSK